MLKMLSETEQTYLTRFYVFGHDPAEILNEMRLTSAEAMEIRRRAQRLFVRLTKSGPTSSRSRATPSALS